MQEMMKKMKAAASWKLMMKMGGMKGPGRRHAQDAWVFGLRGPLASVGPIPAPNGHGTAIEA